MKRIPFKNRMIIYGPGGFWLNGKYIGTWPQLRIKLGKDYARDQR